MQNGVWNGFTRYTPAVQYDAQETRHENHCPDWTGVSGAPEPGVNVGEAIARRMVPGFQPKSFHSARGLDNGYHLTQSRQMRQERSCFSFSLRLGDFA